MADPIGDTDNLLRFRDNDVHDEPAITLDAFLEVQTNAAPRENRVQGLKSLADTIFQILQSTQFSHSHGGFKNTIYIYFILFSRDF